MLSLRQSIRNLPRFIRQFSTESVTCEEIKIPAPWGHIAGKWWGPQEKRPILCSHGWEDNCGSFDTLIPRLPSHVGYLAIDLPGHGLSSQLPPGVFYHRIDNVVLLKRIVDYFNWSKVSLLGHSMGAIMNYQYTLLYPDTVDFLICIDGLKPLVHEDKRIERMVKIIQNFIKYDYLNSLKKEPPAYAFEMLEKMLHEGTMKSIALDSCKYILKRNTAPSTKEPGKYYFTRDGRLKVSLESDLLGWAQKDIVDSAHRITCPLFASKASHSPFFENKQNLLEVIEVIKKSNKNFEIHNVEGTHHVHLNHPERLDSLISTFIKKYDVSDRSEGGLKSEIKINQASSA
ncbi:hypothetical protein ILUMI_22678 [Ignelater luminosus]|uniref:AB hydrolase-1 domain-containing protein n=1 Tax=Ignelater luminosus TaxID=2038154 RepID=A0A8K0C9N9_IGNLU|nr:hypothetical protein ILUMI_22678 [Ignelater luminosus]